jgi:L-asparagine transporter-like permease
VMFIMLWMDDMRASVIVTPIWIFALSIFYAFNKKIRNKNNG